MPLPYLRLTSRSRFEEITDEPEEAQKPESKKRPRDSDAMETDEPKLSKAQQKKLNKKLKAIDELKEKAKRGERLEATQVKKMDGEAELRAELTKLTAAST